MTGTEENHFKEQISFFDDKNKRNGENESVGLLFIIGEKQTYIEYVIPDGIGKTAKELGLPSSEDFDAFLQKSLADLRMN